MTTLIIDSRFFGKKTLYQKLLWISLINFSIYAEYPKYQNIRNNEILRIQSNGAGGGYLDTYFTANIRKSDVHSILEVGSRDALDALKLSEYYHCYVFAFECNPGQLDVCRKNIGTNPNVFLVPLAAWDKTEIISFYPVVQTKGVFFNSGSSSCFKIDKNGHHKTYVQSEVKVQATRLDEWLTHQKISSIDMLCLDVQGAALQVLNGMGSYLNNVKYIITELEHKPIYVGEALRSDVEKFLDEHGFAMYVGLTNRFFGDYLFVRKDIIHSWWPLDPL